MSCYAQVDLWNDTHFTCLHPEALDTTNCTLPCQIRGGGQLQILGFFATPRQLFGPQTVIKIQKIENWGQILGKILVKSPKFLKIEVLFGKIIPSANEDEVFKAQTEEVWELSFIIIKKSLCYRLIEYNFTYIPHQLSRA